MLLGREFFINSQIKLIYENGSFDFEITPNWDSSYNEVLSIQAIEKHNKYDVVGENLDTDLDAQSKENLLCVLREVEDLETETIIECVFTSKMNLCSGMLRGDCLLWKNES